MLVLKLRMKLKKEVLKNIERLDFSISFFVGVIKYKLKKGNLFFYTKDLKKILISLLVITKKYGKIIEIKVFFNNWRLFHGR